ncbi:hypothetical protein GGS26DRAFT_121975 [Hypomontagnella submonticulosa]|nr:hypothetical protein GGS26DRAFT_121975 [Hypomontagnella submonticulosa]
MLFKLGFFTLACATGALAQCGRSEFDYESLGHPDTWPTIKYDGPRFNMTAERKAEILEQRANNASWERPDDMPVIELQPGTHLDFGSDSDSQHEKRRGNRLIAAYGGYNCASETILADVTNFGCGTGCVTVPVTANSGVVLQQYHGNPYPTMDVWRGAGCRGNRLAHFGVVDTRSCTNINDCGGYRSFIGWWNC